MLLSIIIVSYNTKHLTLQTIESALESIQKSDSLKNESQIIVVDNNSTDSSVEELEKIASKNKDVQVIKNKKNLGFSTANNQGIKKATGSYILLLNSDTIVHDTALETLFTTFETTPIDETTSQLASTSKKLDRLGILAATLQFPDNTPQPQGGSFPTLTAVFNHMLFLDDLPFIGQFLPSTQHTGKSKRILTNLVKNNKRQVIQKDWVAATAMLVKKEVFDEIGLLDENIFMYGEDVEFCMRAKNHHWDIGILPKAIITHIATASSSPSNALIGEIKGYLYIWAKHKPIWQMWFLKAIIWWGSILRVILFGTILPDKKKVRTYTQIMKLVQS